MGQISKSLQKFGLRVILIVGLAILFEIMPVVYQPMFHAVYAGTTMQQEDTKPVSRYAFERVQGHAEEPTKDLEGPAEIKSVRELREKITAPVYSKTAGQGASDNSGQLDNSVRDYEVQARARVKQTVDHLAEEAN